MSEKSEKIYVIGHKNPDTDSICSALAYANLKREITGRDYVARRAGHLNEETRYVLHRFNVESPKLLANVKLQVRDMDIHKTKGVTPNTSIKEAWELMKSENIKTLPVLRDDELVGVITTGDIAKSYMDEYGSGALAEARTQYKNIIQTLNGTLITGNEHGYFVKGKVTIGASSPEIMEEFIEKDDLVILGNRYESHHCAVDIDASCIVICQNASVDPELVKRAEEQSIVIICTPYDTFTAARLINQSIPVKKFMSKAPLVTFRVNDYVENIKSVMAKTKFRDFPILDKEDNFVGFISRRRFLDVSKKKVILVDHNEKNQAVDGIEEAEVVEIIDHHKLGCIETMTPVFFRNQPVGCTATIIYQMYREDGVEITPTIAGLLCSAIISDTLLFRSPTCTGFDKVAAEKLSEIAGVNLDELAEEMFNAASEIKGKSAKEICFQDFKQFTSGEKVFGVGQISLVNDKQFDKLRECMMEYLPEARESYKLDMLYFMMTNILDESTELLCVGPGSKDLIIGAFDLPARSDKVILKGVVSRKKQLIPSIVGALQQ